MWHGASSHCLSLDFFQQLLLVTLLCVDGHATVLGSTEANEHCIVRRGRCAVARRCIIICALAARGLGQRATTWTSSCTTVDASAALSFSVTRLLSRAINICRSYSPMITPSCDFGNHVAVATAGYAKLKLLH